MRRLVPLLKKDASQLDIKIIIINNIINIDINININNNIIDIIINNNYIIIIIISISSLDPYCFLFSLFSE